MYTNTMIYIVLIITIFLLVIFLFALFAPQLGRKPSGERLERIKQSPQFKSGVFENEPFISLSFTVRQMFSLIIERMQDPGNREPSKKLVSFQPRFDSTEGAWLTWFGHSTFLYEIDGKRILFDPMLGTHASPLPFAVRRYEYDLPSSSVDLPQLDAVIVSHDHYDHLDYGTINILKNKVKKFIVPLGVGEHLERWGVPVDNIIELDWWQETKVDHVKITSTPSQHFSGRSFTDRKKTLWSSWVVESNTARVFFGGDSGYFPGFKQIGKKFGSFDLTLLDSAQYNERWKPVHMVPEQSVQAHKDLRGKVFMPIHWSGFTLALHAWTEPVERALIAAQNENIEMVTPMIGQKFNILHERPDAKWWRGI